MSTYFRLSPQFTAARRCDMRYRCLPEHTRIAASSARCKVRPLWFQMAPGCGGAGGDSSESHDTDPPGDELDSPPAVRRRPPHGKLSRPHSDLLNQILIDKFKVSGASVFLVLCGARWWWVGERVSGSFEEATMGGVFQWLLVSNVSCICTRKNFYKVCKKCLKKSARFNLNIFWMSEW